MTVCITVSVGFSLPQHKDVQSVGSQRIAAKHVVGSGVRGAGSRQDLLTATARS
jgi:hypothetical protein